MLQRFSALADAGVPSCGVALSLGSMGRVPSCSQRMVLIALLSYDSKAVLLRCPAGAETWRPVRLPVPAAGSVKDAVRRWAESVAVGGATRGAVTGRLRVPGRGAVLCETEVAILKAAGPVDAGLVDASGRWWPVAGLAEAGLALFPAELGLLVKGYVQGWIPDGVITLDA
ncbi:hypothetical protein [Streptomyces sp. NPDC014744]|uniref:hypothetical protein n=1 Tax=Streptomyces sp. NPDC014744 TaxID=3364903 RepID=UPI003701C9C9